MKHDLQNKTDLELIGFIKRNTVTSDLHIKATYELERRNQKRQFWSKTVAVWLAFCVSVVSLIVSIIAIKK